jgi:diguanylate cyclase (GGDEF)-like protein
MFATFAEHASLALAAARSADRMRQAFNDDLTGLANRALFLNRLEHALTVADRRGEAVTVLFLDLDGFKVVNDSLGHLVGDELLVQVAQRIAGSLRRADTAARLGGDEFAVLVQDATTTDAAERAAQRVIDALRQSFTVADREVFVSASIGIARGRSEAETLLREADVAMYHAKALGKACYAVFEQHMHTAALERLELEADLRRGLDRGELELHYQPVFELATRRLRGVEALVRWRHPERGLVPPFEFIPLAEETGLIHRIGNWVLREACEQVAEWNRDFPGAHPLAVSVNLSGVELQRPGLVDEVRAVLEATGIPPWSLVLEITESVLMQDSELTTRRLSDLRALDIRLAIDDFGTGYSSLRYLSRFPVDVLKIAKPFVDCVHSGSKQDLALARMIVDLGANLGLRTVAEGVEVREQEDVMRELGCDFGQGYLLARPLPPREVETLLSRRLAAAA